MLGRTIFDPRCVESEHKEVEGLGLLDTETVFEETKVTSQVEAEITKAACGLEQRALGLNMLKGYEIHMGRTTGDVGLFALHRLTRDGKRQNAIADGSVKGNVWGTYIHGIFDDDCFRRSLINHLRLKRGLKPDAEIVGYSKLRDEALEKWTEVLKGHVDIPYIENLISGSRS
jgi:adenosylcobyric acid synthase